MSRLSVQLSYDKKVAELGKMVEDEAKKLQNVVESKDKAILDLRVLGERKTALLKQFSDLEVSITQAKKSLEEVNEKKNSVLSGIGKEGKREKDNLNREIEEKRKILRDLKKEEYKARTKEEKYLLQNSLERIKEEIKKLESNLPELTRTYQALKGFIDREEKAKKEYEAWLRKITILEEKYQGLQNKKDAQENRLVEKIKELDDLKEYLKDLHGKMGSYVQVMKDTVEWANENLQEKVPIRFNMREIIEINFDNFNVKQTKSDT